MTRIWKTRLLPTGWTEEALKARREKRQVETREDIISNSPNENALYQSVIDILLKFPTRSPPG